MSRETHRIATDSRGFYCLDCVWPGADFCHQIHMARQHAAHPNGGAR